MPILHELLAFENAGKDEAKKKALRESLRALFEGIDRSLAERFEKMLRRSDNTVAVTFRRALANDPLEQELLRVLEGKYKCSPVPRSIDPSRLPSSESVTLPLLALTDVAAFGQLHKFIDQRIDALEPKIDAAQRAPFTILDATPMRPLIAEFKDVLTNGCIPQTRARWVQAKATTAAAAQETDPTKKREGFRKAGVETEALLVLTQLMQLDVDVLTVADVGEQKGVPFLKSYPELYNYGSDPRITPLRRAALNADVAKMIETMPAAKTRFQEVVKALDQRVAEIKSGAEISKKVVQTADILMIAISIYQVAKIPAIPNAGPPDPLTIIGALPGGAALGSSVSVASVASVVESIQKLVSIGALDGAIIAGIGQMGGDSSIAIPELQRPTSLAVKAPSQGAVAQTSTTQTSLGASGTGTGNSTPQKVNWTAHGGKHVPKAGVPWKQIVQSTAGGPAKYKPNIMIETLERKVWAEGSAARNGRPWKVMEFADEVGASGGTPSRWVRVEESSGTIHGHPITHDEFLRLSR